MANEDTNFISQVESVFADAVKVDKQRVWGPKRVRKLLKESGWEATDEVWESKWQDIVQEQWQKLLGDHQSSEEEQEEAKPVPVKREPKGKGKDKYDRAAGRNLGAFIGMVAGDLLGGDEGGEDDDDDASSMGGASELGASEDGSATVMDEAEATPEPQEIKKSSKSKGKKSSTSSGKRKAADEHSDGDAESDSKSKPKRVPSKKKKVSPRSAKVKSAATISDSDEEASGSGSLGPASPSVDGEGPPIKKTMKSSGSSGGGEKKSRKKGSPKQLKEGEEPKGTDEEEARVKKLKNLLTLAGTLRPFSKATGPEKTLTISARLARLEGLLNDLNLPCGSGVGTKMPSEAKAKQAGEAKALAAEMKELSGAPSTSGLRGGKKRAALPGQSRDESDDEPMRPFGAFLKAVQSSSESD